MLKVHSVETFGVHDGPGIRLVIFVQGCPFRCLYCSNPDTQSLNSAATKELTDEAILNKLERQRPYFKDQGGLTISGGEPLLQAQALIKLFKKVKQAGFNIAIDTCGGVFNQATQQVFALTDLVMLDVKHIDPGWHQKITGASLDTVLKNAAFREKQGQPLWLKYVLVPGWTDQVEFLHQWGQHFKDYQTVQRVEILPYHKLGVHKYQALGRAYQLEQVEPPSQEQIEQAYQIFSQYFAKEKIKIK